MSEFDQILRHEVENRRRTMIYAVLLGMVILLTVAAIVLAYA